MLSRSHKEIQHWRNFSNKYVSFFFPLSFSFFFFSLFIVIFPKVSHDLWGHGFFLGVSLPSEGLVPICRAGAGQLRQQGGKGGRGASPADWGRQKFPLFASLQLFGLSFPSTWSFLLLFFFVISILLFPSSCFLNLLYDFTFKAPLSPVFTFVIVYSLLAASTVSCDGFWAIMSDYCCISSALDIGGSSGVSYISVSLIISCIMFLLTIGDMSFFFSFKSF